MPKAYITIEDFKAGLDRRRLEASAAAGSLQVFTNGHINRGGEIVKAKKWVSTFSLPINTFGFAASSGELYVFGSAEAPANIPVGINYRRLQHPDGLAMVRVIATQPFAGKTYVIAEYSDGTVHHFYDGVIVKDWYLGMVRASHTSYKMLLLEIAADMAQDPLVNVSVSGSVMTITAKANNAAFNITVTSENGGNYANETITLVETQAAGSSAPQINTVTLGGTLDVGDKFSILIKENTYGASPVTGAIATCIQTHKNKMYVGAGNDLFFSCVAAPNLYRDNVVGATTNTGSGVINMSAQASNEESIAGLGVYQNSLAIFTRNSTQVWSMSADPALSVQLQTLDNTGTRSPKSIRAFGDLDLFFLNDSGVRSLRARDSSNSASVTDVGTPIDDLIIGDMSALSDEIVQRSASAIEPKDGRYILSMDDTQYVFSFFSTSGISSWSTYAFGQNISDFAVKNGRLYGRADNVIYLSGGVDDTTFVTDPVTIEMPYLDAGSIGTWKRWLGIDVVLEGVWDVYVNTNVNHPDEWIKTARITRTSVNEMKLGMQQYSSVLKFKFVNQSSTEEARISKIIIHYETSWAG